MTFKQTADISLTALSDGVWYVVNADTAVSGRITVSGTVNLILCDGATLTAPAGVNVAEGNTLRIWGQTAGSGTLYAGTDGTKDANGAYTVTCGWHNAGIGGNINETCGTVEINGGTVCASGDDSGSAIGGGDGVGIGGGNCGAGGTVTAIGAPNDAKAISWAYAMGITKGESATTFSPTDDCTRLEFVFFLYKYHLHYEL